jgi:hypothetical protein
MAPVTPTVQQMTSRLIAREPGSRDTPDATVAAAQAACERLNRELSRWVGANGSLALFTRALAEARAAHPVLAAIRVRTRSQASLEGVPETIQKHGAAATADGLTSLLATLLELLGRLIGDDMVMRLVEQGNQNDMQDGERLGGRRAGS